MHPDALINASIIITQRNSLPAIEIRRVTTDPATIKAIVSAAYHDKPIIIMPQFTNKMQSINTLIEKGILYRKGDQYHWVN